MTQGLSVIVPAFNEEANIEKALAALLTEAPGWNREWEILVVDDGSRDRTAELAERALSGFQNARVVRRPANGGFCEAVKTGFSAARLPLVIYVPSDLQFDMRDIALFLREADAGADVTVGCRPERPGCSLARKIQSQVFLAAFRLLYDLRIKDVNWVHLYRKAALETLPMKSSSVFLMAEILIRCRRRGLRIVEIPTRYLPRSAGKASGGDPGVIFKTIREMAALRRELNGGRNRTAGS